MQAANDNVAGGQLPVTIYSTPSCHFCHMAKDFFDAHHVKYEDYNVATDLEKRKEMITRSGQMGVPVIYIGEQMVIGFDEPKIRQLLNIDTGADEMKMAA